MVLNNLRSLSFPWIVFSSGGWYRVVRPFCRGGDCLVIIPTEFSYTKDCFDKFGERKCTQSVKAVTKMPSVVCHRQIVGKRLGMRWLRSDSHHASLNERCNFGLRNQNAPSFAPELFRSSRHHYRPHWPQQRPAKSSKQRHFALDL